MYDRRCGRNDTRFAIRADPLALVGVFEKKSDEESVGSSEGGVTKCGRGAVYDVVDRGGENHPRLHAVPRSLSREWGQGVGFGGSGRFLLMPYGAALISGRRSSLQDDRAALGASSA